VKAITPDLYQSMPDSYFRLWRRVCRLQTTFCAKDISVRIRFRAALCSAKICLRAYTPDQKVCTVESRPAKAP
jgi:hypothetical protein